MYGLRCAGAQQLGNLAELALRDEGGVRFLHAYRGSAVLGTDTPDNGAGVGFVVESGVDGTLEPLLALGAGDALRVEGLGDVERALALEGHVEDALDHGVRRRVRLQLGARLGTVLHVDLPVAEWGVCAHPEATRGGLAHTPGDLLGKIFAVELVHALDDGLHELARRRVVGVLGNGSHPDASSTKHRLEGDGVFALACEAGEFPDQDFLEWRAGFGGGVEHPLELGPVGNASALGLVDVLANHEVAVLLGVVAQCPQLCGDGQVHVLPVAGYSGVEGRSCVVLSLLHTHSSVLLVASFCSSSRFFSLSYRMFLSHSRSSM